MSRKCIGPIIEFGKYNSFLNYYISDDYGEINFYHISGYDYLKE